MREDEEMFNHFESISLNLSFFTIRWITTLLCREFDFDDLVVIWDEIFWFIDRID